MSKSTNDLERLLDNLTRYARSLGLNDSSWATAAGLRKETLSRLRNRNDCDLATLIALARAVDAELTIVPAAGQQVSGHFPERFDRAYEEGLLRLCTSGTLDPVSWRALGPAFFMAGLAVMLASAPGFDRTRYLHLAETLHPGVSHPEIFSGWLACTPIAPSRFIPSLRARERHAA